MKKTKVHQTLEIAQTSAQFRAPHHWREGYDVILERVGLKRVYFQIEKTDSGFAVKLIPNEPKF